MRSSSKPGLKRRRSRRSCRSSRLKGRMQNIIVVKPPNPMFRQAVFFLRDDYFFSSDISRAELLEQAKDAACGYVQKTVPEERTGGSLVFLIIGAVFLLSGLIVLLYFF